MNIKKTLCIPLLILLFNNYGKAQDQSSLRQKAVALYNKSQYANAVVLFEKLSTRSNPYVGDVQKLADSYRKMNNYQSSTRYYSKVLETGKNSNADLLAYAEVLKANGEFELAKKYFTEYVSITKDDKTIAIAGCDSALKWISGPTTHQVSNEEAVNTALSEFSVFANADAVFYTGEIDNKQGKNYGWTGNSFLKVFNASLQNHQLVEPKLYGEAIPSKAYHVGPIVTNSLGNTLFVTQTYSGKYGEVDKQSKSKAYKKNLEIITYSKNSNGDWAQTPFKFNNPLQYSVGHAALSTDEKTMYFISDMPGGKGGTDIWFTDLQSDGSWGMPKNCGEAVNTSEDEMFPSITTDGTLYFSSKGLAGMGGLDIFTSTGEKENWSSAVNLKYPLNSSADDFGFLELKTPSGSTGFFSSNRAGGKGNDDIYSYTFSAPPKIVFDVKGQVFDKITHQPLKEVTISITENGQPVADVVTDEEGKFYLELKKNSAYSFTAKSKGFMGDNATLITQNNSKSETSEIALNLEPVLVKGKTIPLDNIFYNLGKFDIREDAKANLKVLEDLLRENPTLKIELSAHTDSRGKDAFNLLLSQKRAESAVKYLISQGISKQRMIAKGYGETRLLNTCDNKTKCTEEEHQKNRRTEFTILSF